MRTKPFDLAEYEAADPKPKVVDGLRRNINIFSTNGVGKLPVIAYIEKSDHPYGYSSNGRFCDGHDRDHLLLVVVPEYEPTSEEIFAFAQNSGIDYLCDVDTFSASYTYSYRIARYALRRIHELERAASK